MLSNETIQMIKEENCVVKGEHQGYTVVYDDSEDMRCIFHLAAAVVTPNKDKVILVGKEFYNLSKYTQDFILWHEVGHLELHDPYNAAITQMDSITKEVEADNYAFNKVGSSMAIKALTDIADVVLKSDHTEDIKQTVVNDLYIRVSKLTGRWF